MEILRVENLTMKFGSLAAVDDVSLAVRQGEIVGLTGLEGCGKDALARGLFGMEPLGSGRVSIKGNSYHASDTRQAFNQGVAYLPRDRHGYGIVGLRPIRENVTLPILADLVNPTQLLDTRKEINLVTKLTQKLNVKATSIEQPVLNLSGGNQQKVVFAKLTSTNPKLLLLDEPTQGVDVQAKVEIMKIIDQLSQEGAAVVVISEEIRELLDICDRIVVMFKGKLIAEFQTNSPDTTVERILHAVEGTVQAL